MKRRTAIFLVLVLPLLCAMAFLPHRRGAFQGFSPEDIPDLKLWVKADDPNFSGYTNNQPVTQWTDLSGAGNHFTNSGNNRPFFKTAGASNGLDCLFFDQTGGGDSDRLKSSTGEFATNWTSGHFFYAGRLNTNVSHHNVLFFDENPSQNFWKWGSTGNQAYFHWGLTNRRAFSHTEPLHFWHIGECRSSSGDWSVYVDGVLAHNYASTGVDFAAPGTGEYYIGSTVVQYSLDGDLGEILVYSRALTAAEQTKIRNYLQRWIP